MVFFAHCILSRIEINDLKFFHVVPVFTELGQDLTHLGAYGEYAE